MKRMLLVLTVALIMAAMMVASAAPAFAGNYVKPKDGDNNGNGWCNPDSYYEKYCTAKRDK